MKITADEFANAVFALCAGVNVSTESLLEVGYAMLSSALFTARASGDPIAIEAAIRDGHAAVDMLAEELSQLGKYTQSKEGV